MLDMIFIEEYEQHSRQIQNVGALFLVYSHNWLNLPTDDHHYTYRQKFPKKKEKRKKKKEAILLPKDTRLEKNLKKIN